MENTPMDCEICGKEGADTELNKEHWNVTHVHAACWAGVWHSPSVDTERIQLIEQLRDDYWRSFRWMLDIKREPAAELAHAKACAVNEALGLLKGASPHPLLIPEEYLEIQYGEWRAGE